MIFPRDLIEHKVVPVKCLLSHGLESLENDGVDDVGTLFIHWCCNHGSVACCLFDSGGQSFAEGQNEMNEMKGMKQMRMPTFWILGE